MVEISEKRFPRTLSSYYLSAISANYSSSLFLRHVFGREANCCSRVYWIIVLVLLALLTVGGIWESIAGFVTWANSCRK